MQKKWFKGMAAVMAAAALAGAFAGCGGDKKAAQSGAAGQTVKFGFVTAYTGPGAAYGQAMKEGVDLAVEEINKDPKTKMKIDLVTYDTKLNKAEAINAVKKCIEQDKVLAIEGPMTSGEMFAAGPRSLPLVPAPQLLASPILATTFSVMLSQANSQFRLLYRKLMTSLASRPLLSCTPTTMTRWSAKTRFIRTYSSSWASMS